MVSVPSARRYGFELRLHEDVMRDVMSGPGVKRLVGDTATAVQSGVVSHVQATASADDAANYVAALFQEDAFSDDFDINFDGAYGLGNRPIVVIGVPGGRGSDRSAKPPLMVESATHALTSVPGFEVGSDGEDVR